MQKDTHPISFSVLEIDSSPMTPSKFL